MGNVCGLNSRANANKSGFDDDALYRMCSGGGSGKFMSMMPTEPDMNKLNALIKAGIDIRYKDKYGYTALIQAAIKGYVEAVKALVAADSDPAHLNMKSKDGDTALDAALWNPPNGGRHYGAVHKPAGCAECAAVLRAAGAKDLVAEAVNFQLGAYAARS